ncbi:uncharacterized protein LOC123308588 [Coccinella septempunctata]|uniref:uncharacterized protein LOC123308588 n=1 Tax=Coccinella septempunctata TaxID=41139 RepID=UPI001D0817A5|nr:uncharacterized protein LOC123308588 [Coccinella septempunctata]
MKTVLIIAAFFALATSAEIVEGPKEKSANLGPDGLVYSGAFGGSLGSGYYPVLTNVHVPVFRTININPDGTLVNGLSNVVVSGVAPIAKGLQGPSTRTVSIGPDGNVIDSFSAGGFVSDDGSVVVAPSLHAAYGHAVNQVHGVVPYSVVPLAKSVVYTPGLYNSYVPIPYGKSVIAGPSGTIVAK